MRRPSREEQQALLRITEHCGRHNRRFRAWTLLGGKLVAQRCYECEQTDKAAQAAAEQARHG